MDKFARPEWRAAPCDRLVLAALRAQLARPASARLTGPRFTPSN